MTTTVQPIIFKVWQPGQSPDEPFLTLHSQAAMQFFVEALINGSSQFAGKEFMMAAYRVHDVLFERPLAEGIFRIAQEGEAHRVHVQRESGYLDERSGHTIVFAALRRAMSREQVLGEQAL